MYGISYNYIRLRLDISAIGLIIARLINQLIGQSINDSHIPFMNENISLMDLYCARLYCYVNAALNVHYISDIFHRPIPIQSRSSPTCDTY